MSTARRYSRSTAAVRCLGSGHLTIKRRSHGSLRRPTDGRSAGLCDRLHCAGHPAHGRHLTHRARGSPIAILLGCTGLFLLLSTWWAASAGQSFVACFAGTFGGFWIGYSILVLGLLHSWFIIPPAAIANTVVNFWCTFAIFFVFLTLASLRLPIIYTLIFALVVLALCLWLRPTR